MAVFSLGPGAQKTDYTSVDEAVFAGYEIDMRLRDFVFAIEDATGKAIAVHLLVLNPKQFQLEEPAATVIQETRAGAMTETRGVTKRMMTLSGTTGCMPLSFMPIQTDNPMAGLTQPFVGAMNNMMNAISNLFGATPLQGLQEFMNFRKNILWKYYQLKRDFTEGKSAAVFLRLYIIQDAMAYTLEPVRFQVNRQSQTPCTYPYNMQFFVISEAESDYEAPDTRDIMDIIQDGKEAVDAVEDFFTPMWGTSEQKEEGWTGDTYQNYNQMVNNLQGKKSTYEATQDDPYKPLKQSGAVAPFNNAFWSDAKEDTA